MDTRTGEIRQLKNGEEPKEDEVELTNEQLEESINLSPQERVAWWAGRVRGKDRKAAHRGQHAKAKMKRRAKKR